MSNQDQTPKRKKSKYAKKIARKHGKGRVDPRWMWWMERGEK
jgi:hypothetical protein